MIFQEIIQENPQSQIIQEINRDYPLFYSYITKKFKNYALKYEKEIFLEQLYSIINDYAITLKNLELAGANPLTLDKIGQHSKVSATDSSTNNSENVNSYAGYNSDSEFNNITNNTTTNATATENRQSYNLERYIMTVSRSKLKSQWKEIINEICRLFIMFII